MILRIERDLPLLWRGERAMQIGFERPLLRLDNLADGHEHLLSALRAGASLGRLRALGERHGLEPAETDLFLRRLAPALEDGAAASRLLGPEPARLRALPRPGEERGEAARPAAAARVLPATDDPAPRAPSAPSARGRVARGGARGAGWVLSGSGPLLEPLRAAAERAGFPPRAVERLGPLQPGSLAAELSGPPPAAAVVLGAYALAPARYAPWLNRDIPHLGIICGERGVTIGPLVEPGAGPCLGCTACFERDRDPAWPVLAAQAIGLPPPAAIAGVLAELAAATALAAVHARLTADGRELERASITLDAETCQGRRSRRVPHPACGCRSL